MARKLILEDFITDEMKENIPIWKEQGQTDAWIAKRIGVSRTKLIDWKQKNKDFDDLFKKGSRALLLDLEQTLYTRAKGHMVEEKEIFKDSNGKQTIRLKTKYIWSDKCLEMALKKLAPEKWGDHALGNGDTVVIIDDLRKKLSADEK